MYCKEIMATNYMYDTVSHKSLYRECPYALLKIWFLNVPK